MTNDNVHNTNNDVNMTNDNVHNTNIDVNMTNDNVQNTNNEVNMTTNDNVHITNASVFRKLADYYSPTCGEEDVFSVLDKYSTLLYNQPGSTTSLANKLQIENFSFELKSSVSCLTSRPAQFLSLDSLTSDQDARRLGDKINDLVDMVRIRVG